MYAVIYYTILYITRFTLYLYMYNHIWLVVWNIFSHLLGMSSSQLLLTHIFPGG